MNASIRPVLGLVLATLLTGSGATGCGAAVDPLDSQVAADGTQAMIASTQSQDLANVVFGDVNVADPTAAATQLTSLSPTWPSACVSRVKDTSDPATVHVTLTDCTGPFGLVHIDGEELVTFSSGDGGALHVVITGSNLTANGAPIAQSATADLTFPTATLREVIWQGSWTRTNEAGEVVAHTSDLELDVDVTAGCRTADGNASTRVATRLVNTTVEGYKVCYENGTAGCPSGMVVHTGEPSGRTVTVQFDASSMAEVTGAKGNSFGVPLVCTSIGR